MRNPFRLLLPLSLSSSPQIRPRRRRRRLALRAFAHLSLRPFAYHSPAAQTVSSTPATQLVEPVAPSLPPAARVEQPPRTLAEVGVDRAAAFAEALGAGRSVFDDERPGPVAAAPVVVLPSLDGDRAQQDVVTLSASANDLRTWMAAQDPPVFQRAFASREAIEERGLALPADAVGLDIPDPRAPEQVVTVYHLPTTLPLADRASLTSAVSQQPPVVSNVDVLALAEYSGQPLVATPGAAPGLAVGGRIEIGQLPGEPPGSAVRDAGAHTHVLHAAARATLDRAPDLAELRSGLDSPAERSFVALYATEAVATRAALPYKPPAISSEERAAWAGLAQDPKTFDRLTRKGEALADRLVANVPGRSAGGYARVDVASPASSSTRPALAAAPVRQAVAPADSSVDRADGASPGGGSHGR